MLHLHCCLWFLVLEECTWHFTHQHWYVQLKFTQGSKKTKWEMKASKGPVEWDITLSKSWSLRYFFHVFLNLQISFELYILYNNSILFCHIGEQEISCLNTLIRYLKKYFYVRRTWFKFWWMNSGYRQSFTNSSTW